MVVNTFKPAPPYLAVRTVRPHHERITVVVDRHGAEPIIRGAGFRDKLRRLLFDAPVGRLTEQLSGSPARCR